MPTGGKRQACGRGTAGAGCDAVAFNTAVLWVDGGSRADAQKRHEAGKASWRCH